MTPVPVRMGFVYLGQVTAVSPADHSVTVLLNAAGAMGSPSGEGCKARVLSPRASQRVGIIDLPRIGDWGVVAFPGGNPQLAVWLGSLYADLTNICTEDAETHLTQYEGGTWYRVKANGTVEFSHPSGTYVRIGSGTALDQRQKHQRQGTTRQKVTYSDLPTAADPTLHVEHSSGTKITIAPSGAVTIDSVSTLDVTTQGAVNVQAGGNATVHADGNLSADADGSVTIMGADVTVKSASGGPNLCKLGGATGSDYVALYPGLQKLWTYILNHTHSNVQAGIDLSGPPSPGPPVLVADVDYTQEVKAT